MAILSWENDAGATSFIDFDATLLEEYTRSAVATAYPVEGGADLSDHIQLGQRAIALEVIVSDSPLAPEPSADSLGGATEVAARPPSRVAPKLLDIPVHNEPVTGILGERFVQANASRVATNRSVNVLQFDGRVTRRVDVFLALDDLMLNRQALRVLLLGGSIEFADMFITNIRTPRTAESGDGLVFTTDLVQLDTAETEASEGVKNPRPKRKAHRNKRDTGNKAPVPVESGSVEASKVSNLTSEQQTTLEKWDAVAEAARSGVF